MKLSIIIVSYNTSQITLDCLHSIFNATWRSEFEVIVVDNNSKDDSVKLIKQEFPKVHLIENKDNKLFAIANNQGVKIAKGKYVLLLNSDTIVEGDNIQRMIDFFEKCHQNVICIGPKVLNKDGSLQSCGYTSISNLVQHVCHLFFLDRILPLRFISKRYDCNPNRTRETGWVVGACMMIPRELYNKFGGLNESLIFYGEEPEFGYRTEKMGYKTMYYADASIIHLGGASTEKSMHDFEKGMAQYHSLVALTVGVRHALRVAKWTRLSYRLKRLLHSNKAYFDDCIEYESKVIEYFRMHLK